MNKQKIGFWFENQALGDIDLSNPAEGNSGVGGTEYQFVLLAQLLISLHPQHFDIYFFVEKDQELPSGINKVYASNLSEAYALCAEKEIQFLVFRPRRDITESIRNIKLASTKMIPWLHITPKRQYLDWFVKNNLIHRVIFVGDDQRMRTCDHLVYGVSNTIYNASRGNFQISKNRRKDTVVFLGALVPRKGFHILAKAWNEVHKRYPSAKLNVIGSGILYDKSSKLGPLGIADSEYELQISNLLGGPSGMKDKSVYFLGNLGKEKSSFIADAKVGVVNPSGITENCPMSVVEFYEHGIPVISSSKYGLRDMIIPRETGLLCRSSKQLSKAILAFLNEEIDSEELGRNGLSFAENKFSPQIIVNEWIEIFSGNFSESIHKKGYWVHKLFRILKSAKLLPEKFPMVEDQKIYLAKARNQFLAIRK